MNIKALETIKKYNMLPYGSMVTAAVSGGADSMALFRLLCILKDDYGLKLQVAHVNHCLRGIESDNDEELVRVTCEKSGIEFFCLRADIKKMQKTTGKGLEECGRIVRYDFFEKCAKGGLIATAHTLSDCAETLLLNLCRGAALGGLCGIPPVRGNIIRPLIECTREDTESFCKSEGISYAIDSTNNDICYNRNRIRHNVIPQLKQINPSFEAALQRLISQNRCDNGYLDKIGKELLKKSTVLCSNEKNGQKYNIHTLLFENRSVRNRALIAAAETAGCASLSSKHINSLEDIIENGIGSLTLPGNITALVSCGFLEFSTFEEQKEPLKYEIPLKEGEFSTPFGKVFIKIVTKEKILNKNSCGNINNLLLCNSIACDKICNHAVLRNRRERDKITLPKRSVTKSLKKLFNEQGIIPEKRELIAVIADEKGVLWVDGFGCDARSAPNSNTKDFLTVEITEE